MTEQDVIKKIKEITAKRFLKYSHEVELTYDFNHDLGADSFDMYCIVNDICATYDIPYHMLSHDVLFADNTPKTVNDMVTLVCNQLKIQRSTNKNSATIVGLIAIIYEKGQNFRKIEKCKTK